MKERGEGEGEGKKEKRNCLASRSGIPSTSLVLFIASEENLPTFPKDKP